MKAGDIKPCKLCGKGVMHTGLPFFYRVKIERMGVDRGAVMRTAGMETFMGGNVALARIFEDPEIAKPLHESVEVLICETCAMRPAPLALLVEE